MKSDSGFDARSNSLIARAERVLRPWLPSFGPNSRELKLYNRRAGVGLSNPRVRHRTRSVFITKESTRWPELGRENPPLRGGSRPLVPPEVQRAPSRSVMRGGLCEEGRAFDLGPV